MVQSYDAVHNCLKEQGCTYSYSHTHKQDKNTKGRIAKLADNGFFSPALTEGMRADFILYFINVYII